MEHLEIHLISFDDPPNCTMAQSCHYFLAIFGTIAFILGFGASTISIVVWRRLMSTGKNNSINTNDKVNTTAIILIAIESMSLFLSLVEFVRYLFPAMLAVTVYYKIPSKDDKCTQRELEQTLPCFWQQAFPYIWMIFYYLEQSCLLAYQWIHFLLSTERYVYFCQPFKARQICTKRKTRFAVISVIVISLLYSIPYLYEYEIGDRGSSSSLCAEASQTALREDVIYKYLYRIVLHAIVKYIIPYILIIFQTVMILRVFNKTGDAISSPSTGHSSSGRYGSCLKACYKKGKSQGDGTSTERSSVTLTSFVSPSSIKGEVRKKPSQVSILSLDQQLNQNKHQQRITNFCIAIIAMFSICHLFHAAWLGYSALSLSKSIEFNVTPSIRKTSVMKKTKVYDDDREYDAKAFPSFYSSNYTLTTVEDGLDHEFKLSFRKSGGSFDKPDNYSFNSIEIHTSNDLNCLDQPKNHSKWETRNLNSSDGVIECCPNVMNFYFKSVGSLKCLNLRLNISDYLKQMHLNVTIKEHNHKEVAEIIYESLNNPFSILTVFLLLLTSSVNFLIFYRYHGPFRKELVKIFWCN